MPIRRSLNFGYEHEPDYNLLRVFEALYEERSASRAALRLNITQSAVSQRLKTLRELFNDPLFKNTGRGLAPTVRAVALMPQVMASLDQCRACFALFKEAGDDATCQVVVGMSDDFEIAAGSTILRTFAEKLPEVRLVIKQTNTKLVKDMLLARDIDLAVTAGGFDSLSLSRRVISALDDAVVTTKSSLKKNQTEMTIDDIVSRPHLLVQAGGFIGTTDAILHKLGKKRTIIAATSHFSSIAHLLKGTNYIVNMPVHAARALCEISNELCWFPQPLPVNHLNVQVGWKSTSINDGILEQSKDLLIEVLCGLKWQI